MEDIFASCFIKVGYEKERAYQLAGLTHRKYIEPGNFLPYNDALETLSFFHQRGWRNIILSNNVPDLPEIVKHTVFDKFIDKSFSSANIGFEKPNPEAFRFVLDYAGNPQNVWMVGDSLELQREKLSSYDTYRFLPFVQIDGLVPGLGTGSGYPK